MMDWFESWLFPVTQLTATKSALAPFLHFNSMCSQQESSNENTLCFYEVKRIVWIATAGVVHVSNRDGVALLFIYPLYTAVKCTVWIQTAVAVLI